MHWLDFGSQRLKVKVTVTSQNWPLNNNILHVSIFAGIEKTSSGAGLKVHFQRSLVMSLQGSKLKFL